MGFECRDCFHRMIRLGENLGCVRCRSRRVDRIDDGQRGIGPPPPGFDDYYSNDRNNGVQRPTGTRSGDVQRASSRGVWPVPYHPPKVTSASLPPPPSLHPRTARMRSGPIRSKQPTVFELPPPPHLQPSPAKRVVVEQERSFIPTRPRARFTPIDQSYLEEQPPSNANNERRDGGFGRGRRHGSTAGAIAPRQPQRCRM